MGKRKERPETQVVDVPADHQDHETRNGKSWLETILHWRWAIDFLWLAPRRAKTTALNNAGKISEILPRTVDSPSQVWMQLAPKARSKPLKRVAATNSAKPSASKRGRKKQKTGACLTCACL